MSSIFLLTNNYIPGAKPTKGVQNVNFKKARVHPPVTLMYARIKNEKVLHQLQFLAMFQ
jgi:hypothetical protein